MAGAASPPLRVGLIGLGRPGLYLMERGAIGAPFQVVAMYADPSTADLVSPFGVRLVSQPQQLLDAADVDVVWIAALEGHRSDISIAKVLTQKHVIMETPLLLTTAVLDQAFEISGRLGRMLLVHHPRRSDRDFRQALSITEDQTFGRIQAAKFVSWSYGHPPRGVTRGVGPLPPDANDEVQATKMRFVAHALDQLVSLINDQPRCVVATSDPSTLDAVDLHSGQSLSLRITFEQGCHAEIDIRLDSPTQFQSGWLLTAERGGYANGRRFTLTDEGEVFDSPMTELGHGQEADQFDWLAQQIQTGQPDPAEELRLRSVAALLHAAQRSLESRQVITL